MTVHKITLGNNVTMSGNFRTVGKTAENTYHFGTENEVLTLGHSDVAGYHFDGYTVDDKAIEGSTYTMGSEDVSIAAVFSLHTYTYTKDTKDNVINAVCSACGDSYTVKLTPPAAAGGKIFYDGQPKTAETEITAGVYSGQIPDITYAFVKDGVTSAYGTEVPIDAGTYKAKLTLGDVFIEEEYTIAKSPVPPNMPETSMAPAHSTAKVSDITLPADWSWSDADRDTVLADGVAVTATAIYNGTDKGNYETESVNITITRSRCEHKNTEVRNQKAAACTQTGYTGDNYCTDCDKLLETGKEVEALGHDYQATVTKQPTTTEEGVRTYTCSRCHDTYTESIAKITNPDTSDPSQDNPDAADPLPKPYGTKIVDGKGNVYRVTDAKSKTPTVQYTAPKKNAKGTITIPAAVTIDNVSYKVTSIADNAFKNNRKITKIVIGSGIVSIGKNAFAKCTNVTSITIGKNVTKIGKNAFTGCKKLKTITIKSKKLTSKSITKGAFNGISKKTVVKVPKSKYKAYKKLLPAKGLGKDVKIRQF